MHADVVAAAIVAAARETGEDPTLFAERGPARFRHYAFHALLAHHGSADHARIADLVGCPGKPSFFKRSSEWHVLGMGPHRKTPVEWWDQKAYDRVWAATGAALASASSGRLRPTEAAVVVDPMTGARRLAASQGGPPPPMHQVKRDDFLERALRNTAALPAPDEC